MSLILYILSSLIILLVFYLLADKFKHNEIICFLLLLVTGSINALHLGTLEHKKYLFGILELNRYPEYIDLIEYFSLFMIISIFLVFGYKVILKR